MPGDDVVEPAAPVGTVVAEEGEVSGGTEAERVELRGHRGQAVDEVEVAASTAPVGAGTTLAALM